MCPFHERGGRPDRQQRHDVEQIAILLEVMPGVAQVERCHLERQNRDENQEQYVECVRGLAAGPRHNRQCPCRREQERDYADADHDVVEMRHGGMPDSLGEEATVHCPAVRSDERVEGTGSRRDAREPGGQCVSGDQQTMRSDGAREGASNDGAARARLGGGRRERELGPEHRDGKRQGEDDHLRAREECEHEPRGRREIVDYARHRHRPVTEEDRPDEGGIGRVLRQQRRREHEPRRERGHRGGDDRCRPRPGDGARQQIRRNRRAREYEAVERMHGGGGRRWAQRAEERRHEERVQLAERRVVHAVDVRHRRQGLPDAGRELRRLQLVRHHRPMRGLDREDECQGACRRDDRRDCRGGVERRDPDSTGGAARIEQTRSGSCDRSVDAPLLARFGPVSSAGRPPRAPARSAWRLAHRTPLVRSVRSNLQSCAPSPDT